MPVGPDAGAEVGEVAAAGGLERVAGAARGVHHDAPGEPLRLRRGEAESLQQARHVLRVRLGGRVALPGERVELGLRVAGPGEEAAVPEVVRLERPAQPLADQLGDARHQRRGDDGLEQRAEPRLGNLVVEPEAPVHLGGGER